MSDRSMAAAAKTYVVADVMTRKVITIDSSKRVAEAARLMADRHVGCLIVIDSPRSGRL